MKNYLDKFFRLKNSYQKDALDFNLCYGYLMQSCRNGIYFFQNRDGLVAYTKRAKSGPKSKQFVITTAVGKNPELAIASAAKSLSIKSKKDVIVKNIMKTSKIERYGFEEYSKDDWWSKDSKYDDNTYPEQALNTLFFTKLFGPRYKPLRKEIRRFDNEYMISIESYKDEKDFDKILKVWVSQMSSRNGLDKKELKESHLMYREKNDKYSQHIVRDLSNGKVIGFLCLSEVSRKCMGFNAMICDFEYTNLYRKLMHETGRISRVLGYKYLNLQGSEDSEQHDSKRKLKARIQIHKKHMIYRYNK